MADRRGSEDPAPVAGDEAVTDETAVTDEAAVADEFADQWAAADLTATADEAAGPTVSPTVDRPDPWRRTERRALLEIMALCGLVIAQPLLDITGRSPDFFLFHGAGTTDILLLVVALTLTPPLALWTLGALAGLAGRRARAAMHTLTVGTLLAALALQVGKHLLPLRGTPLALLAAAAAAAGLYTYRRWRASGQLLRVASVGPLVFVLLFVFASPTSALMLTGGRRTGSGGAAGSAGGTSHPPVVLLVLDELPLVSLLGPDGRIDAQRFPNFARLAGGSTWYRNATAVSGDTPYALPAMLTGRYPAQKVAPHYSRYPDNLFTLLDGVYDVRASESITQLCPPGRCEGGSKATRGGLPAMLRDSAKLLAQVVSPADTGPDPQASYREATRREIRRDDGRPAPSDPQFRWYTLDDNQPARFGELLDGLRPAKRPTLHFLHLLMPHVPWTYLPSGVRYEAPDDLSNDGDGWVSLAYERHVAQLGYTDRLIGETLRTLQESGLYDDALVVVTADHGLSFTPGSQGRHVDQARRAPGQVLWVPMFIKEPGQRSGRVDDRNWEHVDLLPTIADRVNVPVPWRTDGVPAPGGARDRAEKHYYGEPGELITFPGPATFAAVTSGAARPALPARPAPELVGRATADLPVTDGGSATVTNRAAFADVDPASGRMPALVYGTVPATVPTGTRIAIALNGRIATVVRVAERDRGGRRFAGLVDDASLFRPGANRLEIFEVTGGSSLRRLRL